MINDAFIFLRTDQHRPVVPPVPDDACAVDSPECGESFTSCTLVCKPKGNAKYGGEVEEGKGKRRS